MVSPSITRIHFPSMSGYTSRCSTMIRLLPYVWLKVYLLASGILFLLSFLFGFFVNSLHTFISFGLSCLRARGKKPISIFSNHFNHHSILSVRENLYSLDVSDYHLIRLLMKLKWEGGQQPAFSSASQTTTIKKNSDSNNQDSAANQDTSGIGGRGFRKFAALRTGSIVIVIIAVLVLNKVARLMIRIEPLQFLACNSVTVAIESMRIPCGASVLLKKPLRLFPSREVVAVFVRECVCRRNRKRECQRKREQC